MIATILSWSDESGTAIGHHEVTNDAELLLYLSEEQIRTGLKLTAELPQTLGVRVVSPQE